MGRIKRLTEREIYPDSSPEVDVAPTALYWHGMLPAQGTFKVKKHEHTRQDSTGDYFTWVETSSEQLWGNPSGSRWVGRCPWRQSLSVNKLTFDAFTETLMRPVGATADVMNKISWPGAVSELDEERANHVILQCYKNVIRVDSTGHGSEVNIDQPLTYTMSPNGDEKVTTQKFNRRTDTPFAHYVYFIKLDKNPQEWERDTYYRLAYSWDELFRDTPKSVAEMYPLKDGKIQFTQAAEEA